MKKLVSLLMAILMMASMFSVASAEEPFELDAMIVLYHQAPAEDSDFWKWMESTFNVEYTIEWAPESGYTDKTSLVLSTGDLPDMMQITSTSDPSVVNAANEGLFYDITDLIASGDYPNLSALNPSAWTTSKINGRNYFVPRTRGQYNCVLFLRQDILDAAGMEKPTSISEFEAYFTYIRDNYPDMVPLAYEFNTVRDYFQGAFGPGQVIPVYTEDGEGIIHENLTESFAKTVEWFQHLYAEGIYAKEFALYNTDKNHDMFMAGKTGARHQNLWHRWRLEDAVGKAVEGANLACCFYAESDDGQWIAPQYDIGFYGGMVLNADLTEERAKKILSFLDKTAAPENYNTFRYGMENVHWVMEDGFPVATEQGKAEVTNSFYGPFTLSTNLYDKVDSPLATVAYNKESRAMCVELDEAAARIGACPMKIFSILKSNTWSEFWALYKAEFDSFVADTIAGRHTIDELREYQKSLIEMEEAQIAFKEFKTNYDDFGLANWTAPVL